MESRKIYNRITLLRNEKSLTRKELAEKIGVNFQTIGYLEREEYNPSLDLAFRISEIFELPIDLIFFIKPLPQYFKVSFPASTTWLYPQLYEASVNLISEKRQNLLDASTVLKQKPDVSVLCQDSILLKKIVGWHIVYLGLSLLML